MAIPTTCPACHHSFRVREAFAGRRGKCPECGEIVLVPQVEEAVEELPEELIEEVTEEPSPTDSDTSGTDSSGADHELIVRPSPPAKKPPPTRAAPAVEKMPPPKIEPAASEQPDQPDGMPFISVGERDTSQTSTTRSRTSRRRKRSGFPVWGWVSLGLMLLVAGVLAGVFLFSDPDDATSTAKRPEGGDESNGDNTNAEKPSSGDSHQQNPTQPRQPSDNRPLNPASSDDGELDYDFPPPKIARTLEEAREAIVKFEIPVGMNRMESGTGFFVNNKAWVVTNNHVIAHANSAARARLSDRRLYEIEGIIATMPERDLAVLKLYERPRQLTILDITYKETPALATAVYAFGHPYGVDFSLTKGILNQVVATEDLPGPSQHLVAKIKAAPEMLWIQHEAKILPGNSGGPVFMEQDGLIRVIGVNTFVNLQAEFGYASHIKYVQDLLKKATGEATPLPKPEDVVTETPGEPIKPPEISPKRMQELFDTATGFDFTPEKPEHYDTLAELAKLLTWTKRTEAPEITSELANELFDKIKQVEWNEERIKAIMGVAVEKLDRSGEGAFFVAQFVARGNNAVVLKAEGADAFFVLKGQKEMAESQPGSRWLVVGLITPAVAQVQGPDSRPLRMRVLESRHVLKLM